VDCVPIYRYIRHHLHTLWARDMVEIAAAYQAALTAGIDCALRKVSRCYHSVRDSAATHDKCILGTWRYGVMGMAAMPSICVDSLQ
jgi:hypothetical protein